MRTTRKEQKKFYLDKAKNIKTMNEPGVEIVTFTNWDDKLCSLIWYGKQSKPSKYYAWPDEIKRAEYVNERMATVMAREIDKKVARDKRKKAKHPYKVGDILTGSWGYDQTQVETFQVVDVKNKTIWIQMIHQATVEGSEGVMCCSVVPVKDSFVEGKKPIKKIPQVHIGTNQNPDHEYWYVRMASYYSLRLWDGKPKYNSWYA